jgi:hypothetical protein
MKEPCQWLVAVSRVDLCPAGEIQLPKSGWIGLRFDREHREFNLRAGRVVRLPGLIQASVCNDRVGVLQTA